MDIGRGPVAPTITGEAQLQADLPAPPGLQRGDARRAVVGQQLARTDLFFVAQQAFCATVGGIASLDHQFAAFRGGVDLVFEPRETVVVKVGRQGPVFEQAAVDPGKHPFFVGGGAVFSKGGGKGCLVADTVAPVRQQAVQQGMRLPAQTGQPREAAPGIAGQFAAKEQLPVSQAAVQGKIAALPAPELVVTVGLAAGLPGRVEEVVERIDRPLCVGMPIAQLSAALDQPCVGATGLLVGRAVQAVFFERTEAAVLFAGIDALL